jgi:flavodoxin
MAEFPIKSLIVVVSFHHNNTQKVAEAIAKVLDAEVRTPQQTILEDLEKYDLVGFGSGINTGKNYKELLDFAEKIRQVTDKKAFVFSNSGLPISVSGQQRLEEYTNKCYTS